MICGEHGVKMSAGGGKGAVRPHWLCPYGCVVGRRTRRRTSVGRIQSSVPNTNVGRPRSVCTNCSTRTAAEGSGWCQYCLDHDPD